MLTDNSLLRLLQLASPALPVGAYSYSEGLEMLVETGTIKDSPSLKHWLQQELHYGAIRLEAAVMARSHFCDGDLATLNYWNHWLSAARETEELRLSSWQMGRSLILLLVQIQPQLESVASSVGNPCNYAIAFAIAARHFSISAEAACLGYLHSWATNLITAGVKLIPLGQTAGQQLLLDLNHDILTACQEILDLEDDHLESCGWGLALASMAHETQYTRLFRS